MARPLRVEYQGAFYHVTSRGKEHRKIFYAKSDYDKFKSYLKDSQDKYGFLFHCYILMANHYHLLVETPHGNLQKLMHYINGSYTGYINRRRKRTGEGGYCGKAGSLPLQQLQVLYSKEEGGYSL